MNKQQASVEHPLSLNTRVSLSSPRRDFAMGTVIGYETFPRPNQESFTSYTVLLDDGRVITVDQYWIWPL
jgi:hypothetical protein